jgi:autotransporter-associated beta strand protein
VVYIGGTGRLDQTGGEWMLNYSNAQITIAAGGELDRTGATQPFGLIMNTTTAGGEYAVLNVAGGSLVTTTQPFKFGNSSAVGTGNNNTAIINLAGGTLQVGTAMITSLPTDGANLAYLNFAGGTLKTSAAVANWIPTAASGITFTSNFFGAIDNSALAGAPSFAGGLTFDTNGFNSSLGAVLRGASGSGVAQSSLTVTGGSNYVGAPEVIFTGGTLEAGGSPATGYALINAGAVVGIVITSPGAYSSAPTVTLTGGGGTGATVSVGTLAANTSAGLTKIGAGTLTLSGANTYAGGTNVNVGTLALGASNVLADAGNVTIAGGTLDVATFNDTVATVSLRGGAITGTTGVLTSTTAYDLRDGSVSAILAGSVGLNKTTAATVTLSKANTYSGVTNVTGGTLVFSAANQLGDASATNTLTLNGGTLSYTGSGTANLVPNQGMTIGSSGATLNISDATGTLNLQGGIVTSAAANLTKTGLGVVSVGLGGSTNLNGGNVTVSAGVLNAGFTAIGLGAIAVSTGAKLNLYDRASTRGVRPLVTAAHPCVRPVMAGALSDSCLLKTGGRSP